MKLFILITLLLTFAPLCRAQTITLQPGDTITLNSATITCAGQSTTTIPTGPTVGCPLGILELDPDNNGGHHFYLGNPQQLYFTLDEAIDAAILARYRGVNCRPLDCSGEGIDPYNNAGNTVYIRNQRSSFRSNGSADQFVNTARARGLCI